MSQIHFDWIIRYFDFPMSKHEFIPVNTPLFIGHEKEYLMECIETGWISSEGPFVRRFEQGMAQRVGRSHGIAVANGTVGLEVAVRALGLGPGDEVIMPAFTIISCALAVIRSGAKPVLMDADPVTWNMDVSRIEERITKSTKAIMAVHIYGLPVDMDPIFELAKRYGLFIIEDVAEVQGQTYYDKPCGNLGDVSVYSFYPNKHITTGEGGMLLTNDSAIAEKSKSLRNLCFVPGNRFVHEELGYNFRMTNLQAAVGVAQLERLDYSINKKRQVGGQYNKLFKDLKGFQLPLEKTKYAENIYWVYGMVINPGARIKAKEAMDFLAKAGVEARPFFWSMHEQPAFRKMGLFKDEHYPVAEYLARNGFYIPSGTGITDQQIEIVGDKVKELSDFVNE